MHNLTKIKLFRFVSWMTYPIALIFIYPFVLLKKKNPSQVFFFFDRYAIGGAQRVHLDILNAVNDVFKQVYFTRKSLNTSLKKEFYSVPNSVSKDVHFWCDNLLLRIFSVHYFAFYINRHPDAHVLSSNSTFFYDMLPFIRQSVRTTELLHNFTYGKKGMEFFGLANYRHLTNRIVIDAYTLQNIKKQYTDLRIEQYMDRVKLIEPGVHIPARVEKNFDGPLKVLYAGRGGAQKRIHLINRIAEYFINASKPVKFHFAGTMIDELSEVVRNNSVCHGEISNQQQMFELYQQMHAILMTSAYEGFPMFIKESMACGCIPVVTALEGNKTHLKHNFNALLIESVTDEAEVVKNGIANLEILAKEKALTAELSRQCFEYAASHFGKEKFTTDFRKLLLDR